MTTTPLSMDSAKVLRGTYQLLAKLGSGGMGEVYIAAHTRMSKRFAVKLLAARHGASDEAYARFQREAEITSRLGHPHIVEIIDFDTADDGRPFMVMELLEGEDLADRLHRGAMSVADALRIATQLGSALQAAHDAGIVHRDLKPQNVFITQRGGSSDGSGGDFVKILDFGISKIKDHGSVVTQSQVVIGTPGYMSPEQAEGRARSVDARSDQFALAVIVYEMVSGVAPFAAESIPSTLYRVVHHSPRPLEEVVSDVPAHVSAAVMRGMAKDPAERFADIATFVAALRGEVKAEVGTGLGTSGIGKRVVGSGDGEAATLMHAQTEVSTAGMTQAGPRKKATWIVGGVVVAMAAAAVIAFVALREPERQPQPQLQSQPQPQPQPQPGTRTQPQMETEAAPPSVSSDGARARAGFEGSTPSQSDPSSDTRRPSSDIRRPSSDTRRPSSDTRRPSSDARNPSSATVPVDAGAPVQKPPPSRQDAGGESDFITDF